MVQLPLKIPVILKIFVLFDVPNDIVQQLQEIVLSIDTMLNNLSNLSKLPLGNKYIKATGVY